MDLPDPTPTPEPSIGVSPFSTAATCTPPSTTKPPQAVSAPTGPTEGSSVVNNLLNPRALRVLAHANSDSSSNIPDLQPRLSDSLPESPQPFFSYPFPAFL